MSFVDSFEFLERLCWFRSRISILGRVSRLRLFIFDSRNPIVTAFGTFSIWLFWKSTFQSDTLSQRLRPILGSSFHDSLCPFIGKLVLFMMSKIFLKLIHLHFMQSPFYSTDSWFSIFQINVKSLVIILYFLYFLSPVISIKQLLWLIIYILVWSILYLNHIIKQLVVLLINVFLSLVIRFKSEFCYSMPFRFSRVYLRSCIKYSLIVSLLLFYLSMYVK